MLKNSQSQSSRNQLKVHFEEHPCIDFDKVKKEYRKIAENYKCPLCIGLVYHPITCDKCFRIIGSDCLKKWLERGVNCPISGCEKFNRIKTSPIITSTLDEFELICRNKNCKKILHHDNYYTHSCELSNEDVVDENEPVIKESQLINTNYLNKIVRQFNSDKNLVKLTHSSVDQTRMSTETQSVAKPLEQLVSQGPNKKTFIEAINTASALIKEDKINSAIEICEKALILDPKNYKIPYKIGNSLLGNKNPDKAILMYKKSLEIEPNQKKIYFNIGNALSDQGNHKEAIQYYTIAISMDPNYNQAFNNLGLSLMNLGKNIEAEENFKKAIAINSDHKQAYNNLAVSQLNQKKFTEAAESCLKALDIDLNYKQSIENLDIIMKKQEKVNNNSKKDSKDK